MNSNLPGTRHRLTIGYLGAVLLVIVYLNMFPAVRYIVKHWGVTPVMVLPIMITIGVLIVIFTIFLRSMKMKQAQPEIAPVILGIIICLAALAVPDPQAPVKRIHVVEYMTLSLLIRYTMSVRLQGLALLIYSIFFASLLGVHDELLQGLHPLRTYGTRDIVVNALGSAGGGLIWHGFKLFEHSGQYIESPAPLTRFTSVYLVWLFCSVLFFFIPLLYFREEQLPLWPAFPLAAGLMVFIAATSGKTVHFNHGIWAVSCASYALFAYPIAIRLLPATFF